MCVCERECEFVVCVCESKITSILKPVFFRCTSFLPEITLFPFLANIYINELKGEKEEEEGKVREKEGDRVKK